MNYLNHNIPKPGDVFEIAEVAGQFEMLGVSEANPSKVELKWFIGDQIKWLQKSVVELEASHFYPA